MALTTQSRTEAAVCLPVLDITRYPGATVWTVAEAAHHTKISQSVKLVFGMKPGEMPPDKPATSDLSPEPEWAGVPESWEGTLEQWKEVSGESAPPF